VRINKDNRNASALGFLNHKALQLAECPVMQRTPLPSSPRERRLLSLGSGKLVTVFPSGKRIKCVLGFEAENPSG
jgi:hypothetical protein